MMRIIIFFNLLLIVVNLLLLLLLLLPILIVIIIRIHYYIISINVTTIMYTLGIHWCYCYSYHNYYHYYIMHRYICIVFPFFFLTDWFLGWFLSFRSFVFIRMKAICFVAMIIIIIITSYAHTHNIKEKIHFNKHVARATYRAPRTSQ